MRLSHQSHSYQNVSSYVGSSFLTWLIYLVIFKYIVWYFPLQGCLSSFRVTKSKII